ncbi:helix-turn-helix domain-containing protein [Nesterenkonia haasae]|uniref:helix-turn-helix domain-containing protein n=1 Tax=Nesterenkonia haasae TaxID=2587813 RepID=UPI0013919766|nr:helix-turn-helix domain-containing protein [Nesterenkonia haasae]
MTRKPVPHEERLAYAYQQAADRSGCSISTIRRAVAEGHLVSFPLKGTTKLVIPRESLEDWVRESAKAA